MTDLTQGMGPGHEVEVMRSTNLQEQVVSDV
jgi:hypothetical protein